MSAMPAGSTTCRTLQNNTVLVYIYTGKAGSQYFPGQRKTTC